MIQEPKEPETEGGKAFKLNDNEKKVLAFLAVQGGDEMAFPFSSMMDTLGIDRAAVRRACRSLRRKGLADYYRGLWDEENNQPAGAGYACTSKGAAVVASWPDWVADDAAFGVLHD